MSNAIMQIEARDMLKLATEVHNAKKFGLPNSKVLVTAATVATAALIAIATLAGLAGGGWIAACVVASVLAAASLKGIHWSYKAIDTKAAKAMEKLGLPAVVENVVERRSNGLIQVVNSGPGRNEDEEEDNYSVAPRQAHAAPQPQPVAAPQPRRNGRYGDGT